MHGGRRSPSGHRELSRLGRRHMVVDGKVVVSVPCRSFVFLTLESRFQCMEECEE